MSFTDTLFKILGSRWLIAIVGLLMALLIPFTYQQMTKANNFMGPVIFVVNIIVVLLCLWRFSQSPKKVQAATSEKW